MARVSLVIQKPWNALRPGSRYDATPAEAQLLIGRGIAEPRPEESTREPEEITEEAQVREAVDLSAAPEDRAGALLAPENRSVSGPRRSRR